MFTSNKTGWIGVDVGTSTVKVVQLVRKNDRLQIAAKAIVPRREPWSTTALTDTAPLSSTEQLQAATSFMGEFRGRKTAAALSMTLCGTHRLEKAIGTGPGQEVALRQAIELETQSSAANLQFGCWSASKEPASSSSTNVLTIQRSWTDQLCDDIAQMGWSCQLIDGLPLAWARAVALVHPNSAGTPLAVLDLGFQQTTLCTVIDGQPTYVRSLKGCCFERLLNSISAELNVTFEEAQRLLQQHGIEATRGENLSDTGEILQEIAEDYLENLIQETNRTLGHLKAQRQPFVPKQIYLFGGGATVKGMSAYLAPAFQTNVATWQFDSELAGQTADDTTPSCLLGPAIALSALAWEHS